MKKVLLVCGMFLSAANSCPAATPLWSDGFESYPEGTLAAGGWRPASGYFVVSTSNGPRSGTRHVAMSTGGFSDWANGGWTNSPSVWADTTVNFAPTGDDPFLITYTGWVKILGAAPNTRPVSNGIELVNATDGTIAKLAITQSGLVSVLAVYSTDPENYGEELSSSVPIVDARVYNKLTIRVDLKHGITRFEVNDTLMHLSSNYKPVIGAASLISQAFPKPYPAATASVVGYFDDLSVTASTACPGDLNLDSIVDDEDFIIFSSQYSILECASTTAPLFCSADLNFDGFVDDSDFVPFAVATTAPCP